MSFSSKNFKMALGMAACAAALSASTGALAQANPIEHCRETSNGKKQRIACLEGIILGLMGQPSKRTVQTETNESSQYTNADSNTANATAGLGAEQVRQRLLKNNKAERTKKRKNDKAERIASRIADFAKTDAGYLIIFLENGQIWRQRKSDSAILRLRQNKQYDVEIRKGPVSGYRMKVPGAYQTIVVERLK